MISGYPIVFRKVFSSLSPPSKQSVYEEETGVGLRAEAGHLAGVATEGHGGADVGDWFFPPRLEAEGALGLTVGFIHF